ncbi:hypothetical protein SAMN05192588_0580 [Nonlabens sp. Hel1_33_55]|uniref:hypothetical protein n=1 Tax=Nonlabens sp. Hel1_33_55 TaxID=1336802 RepID=UPI000875E1C0|nr:hypothetical protein [Nonlabens sp. Hel1_33_55]SCX98542.1 hypothetical protein SAMN05192588_0580 [Nonlabens sp. Hel1_33_55]
MNYSLLVKITCFTAATLFIINHSFSQDFTDSYTVSSYGGVNQDGAVLSNVVFKSKAQNEYKWDNSPGAAKDDKLWFVMGSVVIGSSSLSSSGYAYKGKIYPYNDYSGNGPAITQSHIIQARVALVNGQVLTGSFGAGSGGQAFRVADNTSSTPHNLSDFAISSVTITDARQPNTEVFIQQFLDKQSYKKNSSNKGSQSSTADNSYAIDQSNDFMSSSSSRSSSTATAQNQVRPDYTKSYEGQKYVRQYARNGESQADLNSQASEQARLQQAHIQRQQQTEALKQQLYAQNAEVMQMTAQYFAGDQLATGIAQTSYAVASSIASGNLDATSVVTGAANLIGGLIANGQAKREERERQEAIAREEARIAAERKAYFDKLIVERKDAYSKLPAITYPNSATSQSLSTAYFFTTHFEPATLEEENPEITVSDVIAVNRYSDGSWPFLNSTLGKIPKVNTSSIALVGYFNTYDDAYAALSDLTKEFSKNGVTVEIISIAEVFDVPSDAIVSDLGNEAPSTDFWGNPVSSKKKKKAKTSKKPAKNASSDFWGETVKTNKTTVKPKKKITAKKKKSSSNEDDFWGESVPVKKKNN